MKLANLKLSLYWLFHYWSKLDRNIMAIVRISPPHLTLHPAVDEQVFGGAAMNVYLPGGGGGTPIH